MKIGIEFQGFKILKRKFLGLIEERRTFFFLNLQLTRDWQRELTFRT